MPPAYLGRVLAPDAVPAGTCFQVSPGILVTARHVLSGEVLVDNFGDEASPAQVLRSDPLHDLAVLRVERPFPASVAGLSVTDAEELTTPVAITGVAEVDDSGRGYSHLDAPGSWSGGTTRDGVPLGRLSSKDAMPGMSGAPVRRLRDDVVIGVVSGRYNSTDGWLRDSVWVARIEDLQPLLAGLADVPVGGRPLGPVVDLLIEVSESAVRLAGPSIDLTADHGGVGFGLRSAMHDRQPRRAGQLLAESFLPEPLSVALADVLRRAEAADTVVRLGVDAADFASLPWEALPHPLDGRPLALSRLVVVYRKTSAPPPREIPGPLRIVVAIASPEDGSVPVLDYERELRNVLAAVRGARQGEAQVRIVPFATTAAIRAELAAGPSHVLHLSGHGHPGKLLLEDDDGATRPVTADQLIEEAIPPGAMPPVIALSACHTHEPPSFSAALIRHGASVVIGTETSVTDRYSTRLFARVYNELATSPRPEVLAAVAEARRLVQREPESSKDPSADRDEWSVITVHAGGAATLFDPATSETLPPPTRQSLRGLLDRGVGEFVGRRREQRELPALLLGTSTSGVLLHGIGGVGKTTLAAQLVRRIQAREPARRAVVLTGELSVDTVFTKVAVTLRRAGLPEPAEFISRLDERWQDRFDALREDALDNLPLLLILDNFEDNLTDTQIRDAALSGLLHAWASDPARSRLLITSRYPFTLPGLTLRAVGPMSLAETLKFIWSLPTLDPLDPRDLERIWRLVGGHPRTLEYLDALLAGGQARFADVTERLTNAIHRTLGKDALQPTPTLDTALAQSLTLAADDVLLDELLAYTASDSHTEGLLMHLSVHREPVSRNAIEPHAKPALAQLINASLVTLDEVAETVFVHRWTAEELARRWEDKQQHEDLCNAHRQAAVYWLNFGETGQGDPMAEIHDLLEARHHLLAAQARDEAAIITERICYIMNQVGALDFESELIHDTLRWLDSDSPRRPAWLHELGVLAQFRGEYACAEQHYRQVIELWQKSGNQKGVATGYHNLGILAQDQGRYAEAMEHYLQAMEINGRVGNEAGSADGYVQLGILAQAIGEYSDAENYLHKALEVRERLDDQRGIAVACHNLGVLAHARCDYTEAEHLLRRSLRISEQSSDKAGTASAYHELGFLVQARGDLAEAERMFRCALEISEQLGDQASVASHYHQLGMLAQACEDYVEAERLYRHALEINERLGHRVEMAKATSQLGELAYVRNRIFESVVHYVYALGIVTLVHKSHASYIITRLVRLRMQMDKITFDRAAATILDAKLVIELNVLLDSVQAGLEGPQE